MVLVEDGLAEFTNSMFALTVRIEDMDKCIEELEIIGDRDGLHGKMQTAMTSVVATINNEIQALQASKATKDGELQAYKADVEACKAKVEAYKARVETLGAQLKVCMAVVPNGGTVQLPAALKERPKTSNLP